MKLKKILENTMTDLPVEKRKQIADDMEDISRVAMNVSNSIYSGTPEEASRDLQEFDSMVKRVYSLMK